MSTRPFDRVILPLSGARKNPQTGSQGGQNLVRCIVCHTHRPLSQFSLTQLRKKGQQTCKHCTPTPPTKLKCTTCMKTKPLEMYSKTQKKLNERARCMECMANIQADDSEDDGWNIDEGPLDDAGFGALDEDAL